MVSNHFFKSISPKEKENLLIELYETKKQLDNIQKTIISFMDKKNYLDFNFEETLNCVDKTKNSILNSIQSNNGSNVYIAKNNITGEIYDMKEVPFSNEEIDKLKDKFLNNELIIYPIKEYDEFYNKNDGVYYYNNEGIKKSLYTNYHDLLRSE